MRERAGRIGRRWWAAAVAIVVLAVVGATAQAGHLFSDTAGHSTLEQEVTGGDPDAGFSFLRLGPGERPHQVLEIDPANPVARPGRAQRRTSLAYFGQLSDFQLADEESPARVEFLDPDPSGTATSAWRPQEALVPHGVEMSIRQMNEFLRSPVRQAGGRRARLTHTILTGDLADNQQRNEAEWVLRLLEGGTVRPDGGSADLDDYDTFCRAQVLTGALDPNDRYTGVQDYDDYQQSPAFYDPDEPAGSDFGDWPRYPGLMDRAQEPFRAEGLEVPSYVAPGNHDVLVQGNDDANVAFEELVGGCVKPLAPAPGGTPDAAFFQSLVEDDPSKVILTPPDPVGRWFLNKQQYRAIFAGGEQRDDHGFAYVDQDELRASRRAASYYSFRSGRGVRFIALDTSSQGGSFIFGPGQNSITTTDRGNLDHPQFVWLRDELERAERRDELVITFSHHALDDMDYNLADEAVQPCTGAEDEHRVAGVGHDPNPGCDRDPRSSTPLHLGDDVRDLFFRYPNFIAHVAGHAHNNQVTAYDEGGGPGRFWQIKSPAVADWPSVQRLIEVMDNRDGTLSIFGTLIDHAAPAEAPPGCSGATCPDVDSFGVPTLAAIGRTLTYNDPQVGPGEDEGTANDRNVELLISDPRAEGRGEGPGDGGGPGGGGDGGDEPGDGGAGGGAGRDLDCADFESERDAQRALDDDPSDPFNLDADDDGEACELLGGAATATDEGAATDGGRLPFTGLALAVLALIGAALLGLGLTLRRRARA